MSDDFCLQSLLGLSQEKLAHCMTQSVTKTRGEMITRYYTKEHAEGKFTLIAHSLTRSGIFWKKLELHLITA
jgi:hypothetical protein